MSTTSKKTIELLLSAKNDGVDVVVIDGKLQLKVPGNAKVDPRLLDEIRKNKETIIEFLAMDGLNGEKDNSREQQSFGKHQLQQVPLSYAQERLWFIDQFNGSVQYNMPWVFRITGSLDIAALETSFKEMMNRHEILRTVIKNKDGVGYQEVLPHADWSVTRIFADGEWESNEIHRQISSLINSPFDLSAHPMLRATLFHNEKKEYVLVLVLHHIAFDGWSIGIMVNELATIYNNRIGRTDKQLPVLPVQYADYAVWQKEFLRGDSFSAKLNYWKTKLSGVAALDLLPDHSRPAEQGIFGAVVERTLDRSIKNKLLDFSTKERATSFMVLLAVFKVMLHRYSDQQDICVGTPIAGRDMAEVENLLGFFVNSLAIRTTIEKEASFADLLQQVKASMIEAFEYKDVPFEKVVEVLGVERDMVRNPVFQVMFSMQNESQGDALDFTGLTFVPEKKSPVFAKVDLHLNISIEAGGLALSLVYRADLYRQETIARMLDHYVQLLDASLSNSGALIHSLDLINTDERRYLLKTLNDTAIHFPQDQLLGEAIAVHASTAASAIALIAEGQQISYKELNDRATQFAHYLRRKGIGKGDLVGVCMHRCIELVIAMTGIIRAGAAYVPIDPSYPVSRISYMLNDTKAVIVVTSKPHRGLFENDEIRMLCFDEEQEAINDQSKQAINDHPDAGDLAYVIYTSGSTGRPKGVMIAHRSVMNLVHWHTNAFDVSNESRATSMAGIGFDAFGWEIWPYLCKGSSVYLLSDEERFSAERTIDIFIQQQITHCFIPTALAVTFIKETSGRELALRYLLTGGDRLPAVPVENIHYRIINNYGPTENTVVATSYTIPVHENHIAPSIGKPISNTRAYILDSSLKLTPQGVAGELCIGGMQLAEGYVNQPELTKEKFISDPFGKPGDRLYRTGDKARWLPDGNLEFLGRVDDQVKLRGYRIEPGEIESVLQQAPGVIQAVVLLHQQENQDSHLVAFVVTTKVWDKEVILAYAKKLLPEYMIPAILEKIDEIPLTENGKTDRKKLVQNIVIPNGTTKYEAPRTAQEMALVSIWKELLGRGTIGIHDNFFESGGHSLLAMRMASALRKMTGKELTVKKIFEYPTIASLSHWLSQTDASGALPSIARADGEGKIPLSFEQERLWFIDRLHGSRQYHIPWVIRLTGTPDIVLLNASLQNIVERHEVLRTIFVEENGRGYQQLLPADQWQLQVFAIESIINEHNSLHQFLEQFIQHPFNLSTECPFKVVLIRLAEEEYLLTGVVHHIAFDGWSTGILVQELMTFYAAAKQGIVPQLNELPLRYADYAVWQRKYLTGNVLEQKIAYWKEQLKDVAPLSLFTDFPRPAHPTIRGAFVTSSIDRALTDQLLKLSHEQGATLFMTLLTAFNILLYRHTGQSDICIGTPVAGRRQQELESMIGFFLNTLALRSEVDPQASFYSLLQQVKQTTLNAYEHQEVPFEKIVEALGAGRDRSRNAVFQVWMVLQNMPYGGPLDLGDVHLQAESSGVVTSQFDLNLDIAESDAGLQLSLTYCSDLYRHETVTRMLSHFISLLHAIVADASLPVGLLPMLPPEELASIAAFSNPGGREPVVANVIELFDQQVSRTPSAAAVEFDDASLSYDELNERANVLAAYLVGQGVHSGDRVGLCIERGFEMIIGILGVLKAGAAYVPMDPSYPADRLQYMITDSGCSLVLTTSLTSHPLASNIPLIYLDNTISNKTTVNLPVIDPASLAYVIYTSGSSGRPKGVLVEHRSVVNLVDSQQKNFSINVDERILQFSNYCFDASVEQIFLALLSGATLVLMPQRLQLDLPAFEEMLIDRNITHLHATPGFLDLIVPKTYPKLKRMIAGGEACPVSLAKKWRGLVEFYNEYGPTETTVTAIELLVNDELGGNEILPIGKPLEHVQVYLFEPGGSPAGIGIPADIFIGGIQLARGYMNLPGLTEESFTEKKGYGKLYRTGDKGRWLDDGNIAYLGRADEQVKIRGYRIEPAEIESVLQQAPGIHRAVVLVHEEATDKRLLAYLAAGGNFDREEVLLFIKSRLPEYMVPAVLVQVEEIPLTSNGKVDKKKLRSSFALPSAEKKYVAPRTAIEETVVSIWQELLEVENPGIHDNFFELGGHSLLAVRVIAAIRSQLGKELPVVALFEYPTIVELSQQISSGEAETMPAVTRYEATGRIPLSFSQERLWFIDKLQGSVQYHMPWVFRVKGSLDIEILEAAFREIVDRHEILRTVIREEEGAPYQQVMPLSNWAMQYTTEEEITSIGSDLKTYISTQLQQPYDLSEDSMFRLILIRISAEEHVLMILLHHIAFDGWSISIMAGELAVLYNARLSGAAPLLSELPVQYKDYAGWQRNYLSGRTLNDKLAFWKNKLAGIVPLNLPTDYPRPAIQSTRGRTLSFSISKELTAGLNALSHQTGATLFMTLSAVFKILLLRYTGQDDITIGTPVANRMQASTDSLVGFFVNTLVLRDDLSGDPSFISLLQQVRANALDVYAHQDTPFEKIVEEIVEERSMSYTPLFQVLFALQNVPEVKELELSGVSLVQEIVANSTAKFDLYCDIVETQEGLQLQVEYCTDLFHHDTIARMFGHYMCLLRSVVANPFQKISALQMISKCELLLLQQFNDTSANFTPGKTIIGMFEEQAARDPAASAVVFGDASVSYAELNERANKLAHYLIANGIGEGQLAIVCLERSIEMIIAVLGILKAGAAYVPVDPTYPKERIAFMLRDADAGIVVTSRACSEIASAGNARPMIRIDGDWKNIDQFSAANPGIIASPSSLCYVIYTSGSTGIPKGVELTLEGLTNLLLWQEQQTEGRLRIMQFASLNFDVSFQEIFSALCFGNSLHLIGEDRRKDMHELMMDLNQQQITSLFIPYVVLKSLAAYAADSGIYPVCLREIFTAGEQLKLTTDIQQLADRAGFRLLNQYGPSEAHVVSSYQVKSADYTERVLPPIGHPIANTQLYVLDRNGEQCGIGIAGELYIGGVQVGHGYLNRPELTKEKFIADRFSGKEGARLYATGDKARWLSDGNIEFLGRLDDQVKIHGYRIELGEVEASLQKAPGIRQAVVLVKEDREGHKLLVGYVVPEGSFDKDGLQEYLRKNLPAYMIPAFLIPLETIPVTANGKADKKHLPGVDLSQRIRQYEAPRTVTEEKIIEIWERCIGVRPISVRDNFFEIGGHSLLVTRLAAVIRKEFEMEISVSTFFQLTTPEALAAYIDVNQLQESYDADSYETVEL